MGGTRRLELNHHFCFTFTSSSSLPHIFTTTIMASLIRPHAIAAARRTVAPTLARTAAQRSVVAAARTLPTISSRSAFSTTPHRLGSGTTDAELSSRLAQELSYERDNSSTTSSTADEPDFLRDFKSTNTWTIQDVRGSDEICLEREFGNEKIRVLFSIGDIDAPEGNEGEDDGMEGDESSGRDAESDDDGSNEPALPVRCAITISKPSNLGALTIDAQAESGQFTIENISFYKDSTLATELTAEADWKRRGLYIGPQFPTLDDALQEHFQGFLEERGIDDDLALFVPLFAEWKEQKGELGVAQRTGAQADLLDSIARTHRVLHLA